MKRKNYSMTTPRTLREAKFENISRVDVDHYLGFYQSKGFNDPCLFTDKSWWTRFKEEIKEMRFFRRK
jgi:hypothetical protein